MRNHRCDGRPERRVGRRREGQVQAVLRRGECGVGPFQLGSQLQLVATVKPGGDVHAVEKAIDQELAALLSKGPTASEIQRVVTSGCASFVRGIERIDGSSGKSYLLAQSQVFGG